MGYSINMKWAQTTTLKGYQKRLLKYHNTLTHLVIPFGPSAEKQANFLNLKFS